MVVGGGCNVISVSKGASCWSKESTLCVGRQQVGGGKREGSCQQRGGGLHGGGLLGGGSRGGGGVVGFHWHWFHCITKEESGYD